MCSEKVVLRYTQGCGQALVFLIVCIVARDITKLHLECSCSVCMMCSHRDSNVCKLVTASCLCEHAYRMSEVAGSCPMCRPHSRTLRLGMRPSPAYEQTRSSRRIRLHPVTRLSLSGFTCCKVRSSFQSGRRNSSNVKALPRQLAVWLQSLYYLRYQWEVSTEFESRP